MKQIFLFLGLLLPICAFSQLIERFDGPEITTTYPWEGNIEQFAIHEEGKLQFNGSGKSGTASCYVPITYTPDMQWTFDVGLSFKSSNNNHAKIYVYATDTPSSIIYFVQVGHNDHNVSLYRQKGNQTPTRIIAGTKNRLGEEASSIRVKLTLEQNRTWTLYTALSNNEFIREASPYTESTLPDIRPGGKLNITCKYKAKTLNNIVFTFDNIEVLSKITQTPLQPEEPDEPEPDEPSEATPPLLLSLIEEDGQSLRLTFDQAIEPAYSSIRLSDKEADELYITDDKTILKAVWNNKRKKGESYTLQYSGIYDEEGDAECKGNRTFISKLGEETIISPDPEPEPEEPEEPEETDEPDDPTPITPGSILINEIMAKPDENVYPEYVELYNPTSTAYALGNCIFLNGNKQKVLPEVTLPAGSYAVIYHTDKAFPCPEETVLIPIAAFPALNNNGKTLQFKNPSGVLLDEVTYAKAKTGISWERSDNDWHLCTDGNGGTPGTANSPEQIEPDTPEEKPEEPEAPEDKPDKPEDPQPPQVPDGSDIAPGEIIFNELLPNPSVGGSEYIELYNRSAQDKSIAGLSIATRKKDGELSTHYPLASITTEIEAGGYALLSKNTEGVSSFYLIKSPDVLHELKLPILANTSSTLVLFRTGDRTVIDEVNYSVKWHSPSIKNEKGVALERIDTDKPTQDPSNWTSAAEASGYGTPGYENSQQGKPEQPGAVSAIDPPVFSDQTGDYAIAYYLDDAGYNCRAYVFDTSGRQVAQVANHELLGTSGELRWNGHGSDGKKLYPGIYILYVELYHPAGKSKRVKTVFLVK